MSPERIEEIAKLPECHHGGDFARSVDPMPFARAVEAATLAIVTHLVQQMREANSDLLSAVSARPSCQARVVDCCRCLECAIGRVLEAKKEADAFLSSVTKENSDAGSTIEWQVRGRHHYEWRRASEEIARAMYLVNPGHVRAVTVVEGAVPKAG